MLFQNVDESVEDHCVEINKRPSNASCNERSLELTSDCQNLVRYGRKGVEFVMTLWKIK